MSRIMYLTCESHNPVIRGDSEVGHNTAALPAIRAALANRAELIAAYDTSEDWLDLGDHRKTAMAYFLGRHRECNIGISDEYLKFYTTEEGGHEEAIDEPCNKWCPLWVEPVVAPVRRARINEAPHGTVSWDEFLEAYQTYHEHHPGQTAETIESRGGFGLVELTAQLGRTPATWEPDDRTSRRYFPKEMR